MDLPFWFCRDLEVGFLFQLEDSSVARELLVGVVGVVSPQFHDVTA